MTPASLIPSLWGTTAGRRVPVYIGSGMLGRCGRLLHPRERHLPLEIVTDRTVNAQYGERVREVLERAGWAVRFTILPPGEKSKSAETVARLHERWFRRGLDRSAPVVALGGGVIGDTVGFAAATFLRGLPLWQVPTTLLSQVDASLGGKVGINHPRGKNLIGSFYQPAGVIIDPRVLGTLSQRERRSGLAEVVKYGMIADRKVFDQCERRLPAWISGAQAIPEDLLRRCAEIKLRVVAIDETDTGLRKILNFGHTLGHAFERWGEYRRFRHGEAVALGMVAAGWLSVSRSRLSSKAFTRLCDACSKLRPVGRSFDWKIRDIIRHLTVDKKRAAGRNTWILPEAIGKVYAVDDVTDKEIRGAIACVAEWMV